jgi:hypothetical protein
MPASTEKSPALHIKPLQHPFKYNLLNKNRGYGYCQYPLQRYKKFFVNMQKKHQKTFP